MIKPKNAACASDYVEAAIRKAAVLTSQGASLISRSLTRDGRNWVRGSLVARRRSRRGHEIYERAAGMLERAEKMLWKRTYLETDGGPLLARVKAADAQMREYQLKIVDYAELDGFLLRNSSEIPKLYAGALHYDPANPQAAAWVRQGAEWHMKEALYHARVRSWAGAEKFALRAVRMLTPYDPNKAELILGEANQWGKRALEVKAREVRKRDASLESMRATIEAQKQRLETAQPE